MGFKWESTTHNLSSDTNNVNCSTFSNKSGCDVFSNCNSFNWNPPVDQILASIVNSFEIMLKSFLSDLVFPPSSSLATWCPVDDLMFWIWILILISEYFINPWGFRRYKKWNESGFRPPLCTYRLNWARRTSWGWWDDWDDTVLQTQDSKFEPWRSEAEHATSRSRRLPTILTFTRGWGRNNFVSFKPPRPGTEPRTLAWKAAVLTTTLGPPPFRRYRSDWIDLTESLLFHKFKFISCEECQALYLPLCKCRIYAFIKRGMIFFYSNIIP